MGQTHVDNFARGFFLLHKGIDGLIPYTKYKLSLIFIKIQHKLDMMTYHAGPIHKFVSLFFPTEETLKKHLTAILNRNFDIFNAIFMKTSIFIWNQHTLIMFENYAGPNNIY